jgi:glycosyltransferase involved in cell wall biosynthesis
MSISNVVVGAASIVATPGTDEFPTPARGDEAPWVVFVSDIPLAPGNHGSRVRSRTMVRALRAAGYSVAYLLWERYPDPRTATPASRAAMTDLVDQLIILPWSLTGKGHPTLYAAWQFLPGIVRSLMAQVRDRVGGWWRRVKAGTAKGEAPEDWYDASIDTACDLLLRSRPAVAVIAQYAYLAPALPRAHGILGLIDTIDVLYRNLDYYRTHGVGQTLCAMERETETHLLKMADWVIAIQPREAELLRDMVGAEKVMVVEHGVVEGAAIDDGHADPAGVVLMGSDNVWNTDGLTWFLAEVWPRVLASRPDAALHVYGELSRVPACRGPGVHAHGFVADIKDVYARAHVAVNPVRFGTGLKIKTVDALAHGRAVVTTPAGAEGLEDAEESTLLVARDPSQFADLLIRLLASPDEAGRLGERARAYARKRFSPAAVYAPLLDALAGNRPGWAYQVARSSDGEGLRRPVPPEPGLGPSWGDAWRRLGGGTCAEIAALVREAVARAGAPSVELWSAEVDDGVISRLSPLARALSGLGFRCRLRLPEGCGGNERRAALDVEVVSLPAEGRALPDPPGLVHLFSPSLDGNVRLQQALVTRAVRWLHTYELTYTAAPPACPAEVRDSLRAAWRKAGRICFVSEYDRGLAGVTLGLRGVRHCTVWNGVAPGETRPSRQGEETAFVWLWPGPAAARTRPDVPLRAVRRAVDLGLDRRVELWMLGCEPAGAQLREEIRDLGLADTVRLMAATADAAEPWARADGLLLTSDFEGLPREVVRAMAAGKPLVATAVGGVPEIVRQGREGVLCASGDVGAVAAGIRKVVNEPEFAARTAAAAAAVYRSHLTLEEMGLRYALLYLDALSPSGS